VIAKRAAIKVLHPALSVNREAVERFVQEARAVNQINHPNIVDIFAFGTLTDGRSYFVMERLHGETLRERMARGPVPLLEALAVLETITLALEAAHERGVVHRDLKPDNIYLVALKHGPPVVKLLDFGIAKLVGGERPGLAHRTRTGNLLGTPAYMSPEQARGQDVDHRTDIYALGALAFELVTGQLPYPADNGADMIAKHLHAAVPSAEAINSTVPAALDHLIRRMLDKDAGHRPTLAEVRAHLHGYRDVTFAGITGASLPALPGQPMTTPLPSSSAARPPLPGWWKIGAAVVLVAIAAGVAFVALRGDPSADEPTQPSVRPVSTQPAPKPAVDAHPVPTPEPKATAVNPDTDTSAGSARPDAGVHVDAKPAKPTTARPIKPASKPKKPPGDDDDAPM